MRVVSISLLLVCFLASPGVLCPAVVAAEQISPSEEGLDSLMFSYSILEEEVAKSYREMVEELNGNYVAALEREMANVKAKGDLQGVLAIQKEIEVVQQEGAPGKEGFPGKEEMQATYSDAREAIEAEEEKALGELAAKHIVQLKSLRSALVKASKIEVAKKADAEIKRLSKTGVETEGVLMASGDTSSIVLASKEISDSPIYSRKPLPGTFDIEPGIYRLRSRLHMGNPEDKSDNRFGIVNAPRGTTFDDCEFFVDEGALNADGTYFVESAIHVDLGGEVNVANSIFDRCILRKGGAWSVRSFSAKWTLRNCVLNRCFVDPNVSQRANGIHLENCTVLDAEIDSFAYYETPVRDSQHKWRTVRKCHFIRCRIPETFALMTEDCLFEDCTFVGDIDSITPEEAHTVELFLPAGGLGGPSGGGEITFKNRGHLELREDVGSTLRYGVQGKRAEFR